MPEELALALYFALGDDVWAMSPTARAPVLGLHLPSVMTLEASAMYLPRAVMELIAPPSGEAEMEETFGRLRGDMVGRNRTAPQAAKVRRNEACPCGSGKKHKRCCGRVPGLD